MSKLPASYRILQACPNCAHVFRRVEHEGPQEFFCTLNAPQRPLCMSVAMDECPDLPMDALSAAMAAWNAWAEGREVRPYGYCNHYEQRDKA